jgi:hypothetical protein
MWYKFPALKTGVLRQSFKSILPAAEVERFTTALHNRRDGRANRRRLDCAVAIQLDTGRIVVRV